ARNRELKRRQDNQKGRGARMSNPYEGDSNNATTPGLTGSNSASGIGVKGVSASGEAVHGDTNSTNFAAVAAIELNPSSNIAAVYGEQRAAVRAFLASPKARVVESSGLPQRAKAFAARATPLNTLQWPALTRLPPRASPGVSGGCRRSVKVFMVRP